MEKIKVAKQPRIAVISLGRKGGGPAYSYEMTKGLIENGCKIYLFISKYAENLDKWLSLETEKTEAIKTYKNKFSFVLNTLLFRFFKYKSLKRKLKHVSVDACYIPMAHPWDCYLVNSLNNPQKIVTIHDPINHSSNNSNITKLSKAVTFLNRGIFNKKPDDVIILSKVFANYIISERMVEKEHVHVIPHCIFSHYSHIGAVEPYKYDSSRTNFLFFGRIDKYKGLDVLASAFSKYLKFDPNATLTIVGSGDFSLYKELYNELDNVTVINRWIKDEEVASFFQTDRNVILVLPYKDATQSGVIPIAMSECVPVIASNTGGLVEQIDDKVTGFLFEANDSIALAEKMKEVSKTDKQAIISNAKKHISRLTGKELSKRIIDIVQFNDKC